MHGRPKVPNWLEITLSSVLATTASNFLRYWALLVRHTWALMVYYVAKKHAAACKVTYGCGRSLVVLALVILLRLCLIIRMRVEKFRYW